MAIANAANVKHRRVSDPNAAYESMVSLWLRNRAVCSGERFAKEFDTGLDIVKFTNLLIPFSPSMTSQQYDFYKAEAELPGITTQLAKMLVGGLLRKKPVLSLPERVPKGASEWLLNEFSRTNSSMTSFLDSALWEEMQTGRAWIFVDYPTVKDSQNLTTKEREKYTPYPVLQKAETIINWRAEQDSYGKTVLKRIIVKGWTEVFDTSEFHPTLTETVWVHELSVEGNYQIRIYSRKSATTVVPVVQGQKQAPLNDRSIFELEDTLTEIKENGNYLKFIPAWPLNGEVEVREPLLSAIVDKEVSLYNKLSRRNHLLYGASTYTPIISSDMGEDDFTDIVEAGLGSWLKLRQGDTATVLETPTAALQDMERAIAGAIEEMARLGVRMLTPDSAQSGVALEIRNAPQTAQLGALNLKVSETMSQIIAFMIKWRYDIDIEASEVEFSLSADFNPTPIGADWLKLATEWYQQGLIPRAVWLGLLKQNDLIDAEYDDIKGGQDIAGDELINPVNKTVNFADSVANLQKQ